MSNRRFEMHHCQHVISRYVVSWPQGGYGTVLKVLNFRKLSVIRFL